MAYAFWKSGYTLKEIPIIFYDRKVGKSKMSRSIFIEAFLWVLRTRFWGSQIVNPVTDKNAAQDKRTPMESTLLQETESRQPIVRL